MSAARRRSEGEPSECRLLPVRALGFFFRPCQALYGAPPYSGDTQKTESHKDQGRRLGYLHEKSANLATGILGRMKIDV